MQGSLSLKVFPLALVLFLLVGLLCLLLLTQVFNGIFICSNLAITPGEEQIVQRLDHFTVVFDSWVNQHGVLMDQLLEEGLLLLR